MKKIMISLLLCMAMVIAPTQKSHAIVWVVVKAAIKKVIKAIDLQIQRQQNKVIWAQNVQKQLENVLSKYKLDEISNWTQKQKDQYKKYFDELQNVRSVIVYYQRIKDITSRQTKLLGEYNRAWGLVRNDKHFTPQEIAYIGKVYAGILNESIENIDQITLVITSLKTQMSDQKRLELINEAANRIETNYNDLREFNAENAMLSLQRAKGKAELQTVKSLYGLQ